MSKFKRQKNGKLQKRVLLLLLGGLALGLSRSPRTSSWIIREIQREWQEINRQSIERAIKTLYVSKHIETQSNSDGTETMILSNEGKKIALRFNIENMKVTIPKKWDQKWRIVTFDVPEKLKKVRESLRMHLRNMKFVELQKSVFVHPADCRGQVEYIVEFYDIRRCVRYIIADSIDNEIILRKHFNLL